MKRRGLILGATALLSIGGCKTYGINYNSQASEEARDWNVKQLNVVASSQLTSSLDNTLTPSADIVWFENLPADEVSQLPSRRPEVRRILAQNVAIVTDELSGLRDVRLDVVLEKFQGLTPLQYSTGAIGGVHHVAFSVTAYDFNTGEELASTQIVADTPALGKGARDEAAAQGQDVSARVGATIQRAVAGWFGLVPDVRESNRTIGI